MEYRLLLCHNIANYLVQYLSGFFLVKVKINSIQCIVLVHGIINVAMDTMLNSSLLYIVLTLLSTQELRVYHCYA